MIDNIPKLTLEGLRGYMRQHRHPGDWLYYVLTNDLCRAVGRADDTNLAALRDIMSYVHLCLPARCHGSPEAVKAWLNQEKASKP